MKYIIITLCLLLVAILIYSLSCNNQVASLPPNISGTIPSQDGASFHFRIEDSATSTYGPDQRRAIIDAILAGLKWTRDKNEINLDTVTVIPPVDRSFGDAELTASRDQLLSNFSAGGAPTNASYRYVNDFINGVRTYIYREQKVYHYYQHFAGHIVETAGINLQWNNINGIMAISGRVFNDITVNNDTTISEREARAISEALIDSIAALDSSKTTLAERLIHPYNNYYFYTWRIDVSNPNGPYRVWVDAGNGQVLQCKPLFAMAEAGAWVGSPGPNKPRWMTFEVEENDPMALIVNKPVQIEVKNLQFTDYPFEELLKQEENAPEEICDPHSQRFNPRFFEVNAFCWFYNFYRRIDELGKPFDEREGKVIPKVRLIVNWNATHYEDYAYVTQNLSSIQFGIGGRNIVPNSNQRTGKYFNLAGDASIVVHEAAHWARGFRGINLGGALDEGLADFWAMSFFNTPVVGEWASLGGQASSETSTPQDGTLPREADERDMYWNLHNSVEGRPESHSQGQTIAWALWSSLAGMKALCGTAGDTDEPDTLARFLIEAALIRALPVLTTSEVRPGLENYVAFASVLDGMLVQLKDLRLSLPSESGIDVGENKITTGFARAGIFSRTHPTIAAIDISSDRISTASNASIPKFTIYRRINDENIDPHGNITLPKVKCKIEVSNDQDFDVSFESEAFEMVKEVIVVPWTIEREDWEKLTQGVNTERNKPLYYRVLIKEAGHGWQKSTDSGSPAPHATIVAG